MEIVWAAVVAIFICLLFYNAFKSKGPWGSLWSFFLIILLAVWAAALWIEPVGPVYGGVAWFPLIFIGLAIALLLAAFPTSKAERRGKMRGDVVGDVKESKEEKAKVANSLSVLFWVFIALMILAVGVGYIV